MAEDKEVKKEPEESIKLLAKLFKPKKEESKEGVKE